MNVYEICPTWYMCNGNGDCIVAAENSLQAFQIVKNYYLDKQFPLNIEAIPLDKPKILFSYGSFELKVDL